MSPECDDLKLVRVVFMMVCSMAWSCYALLPWVGAMVKPASFYRYAYFNEICFLSSF